MNKLAIHGGSRLISESLPAWPSLSTSVLEDIRAILETGEINYWTGRRGMAFESCLAAYLGGGYAVTTTNGTSALHTAIAALGIGSGDEVICQSYTFIATAFSILQAGAIPVFADIDQTHTLDPKSVESKISEKTRAIIVVHTFGVSTDMGAIMTIARNYGLKVIEDCAQALGAKYDGSYLGTIGDAGCFSFCQSKHITTGGEGGAVYVKSEELAWKCRSFRDHGYDVEKRLGLFDISQKLPYIHTRVGFNYRMTEIQSAIGLTELTRFKTTLLKLRIRNGRLLSKLLEGHPLIKHPPVDDAVRVNSFWWAPFVLNMDIIDCDVKTFAKALEAEGAPAYTVPWPEIYNEEAFQRKNGFGTRDYPFNDPAHDQIDYASTLCHEARRMGNSTIAFLSHPVYSVRHIELFAAAFDKVYEHYKMPLAGKPKDRAVLVKG
ncbi:DegT/DnrJ/EryC1/StrS family aminotransferase [Xanthomonas arboricola]|uniref:DegT/DnrJ/EryC1/StrS family aminotransferase n=1 Tax=Xanthomonas arboricola TaxID=56448 RepID=UPI001AFA93F3|nr:DegT/DnrJ/EryC1/StrS family aminotransferase [Xanthomonas arboricola]CAD7377408.1 DegT/DnrJ/EryC1/StrS family aminotransferase [Xanthomonas arboricola]CAG2085188.1 DegT/DnrJ/EryC1/StrS family aminotransferase [Xanthomonas arboricola pv. juglandis]